MNIYSILNSESAVWYNYAITAALVPIGFIVVYRIFIQYKIIIAGNNQVEVKYPVRRKSYKYSLQEIDSWKESIVKTGKNSVYKELEIRFSDNRKISLGLNEYSDYKRLTQYLTQKVPRKKQE